jgi:hypothetical protein
MTPPANRLLPPDSFRRGGLEHGDRGALVDRGKRRAKRRIAFADHHDVPGSGDDGVSRCVSSLLSSLPCTGNPHAIESGAYQSQYVWKTKVNNRS